MENMPQKIPKELKKDVEEGDPLLMVGMEIPFFMQPWYEAGGQRRDRRRSTRCCDARHSHM